MLSDGLSLLSCGYKILSHSPNALSFGCKMLSHICIILLLKYNCLVASMCYLLTQDIISSPPQHIICGLSILSQRPKTSYLLATRYYLITQMYYPLASLYYLIASIYYLVGTIPYFLSAIY